MPKKDKHAIREAFNAAVFQRDCNRCVVCRQEGKTTPAVDAHHITDRKEMPSGGYVAENGIAVCASCHWRVEAFHITGTAEPGLHPDDLYRMIGSSREAAFAAAERLDT